MLLKKETQKFLDNAPKEELENIKWLLEHSEYVERPVDIVTFVQHPHYLALRFVVEGKRGYGCRPRILERLEHIFDPHKRYEEFVLMCGIGWGKDFTSSIVLSYQIYRLSCLKDPQTFFGLAPGTAIHLMLMSINEKHARDVLFSEVKARIDNSEWFKRNCKYNSKVTTEFQFPKNILLIPGNSKDTSFVGYNIFCAIIDEGDDYVVTANRNDAVEGYHSIKQRIVSRFRNRGMLGIIGSPKTVGGFMMGMYENKEGVSNRYKIWVPTWDSLLETPILCGKTFEYKGLKIPIEYKDAWKSDPERFLRDMGARPALSKQPFITLTDAIVEIFDTECEILFDFKEDKFSFGKFKEGITGKDGELYFAHLDLAVNRLSGDKLGFALGHPIGYVDLDGIEKPIIQIDIAMAVTAPPGGEIQFSDIKKMIYYLEEKGFLFGKVTADSWNSIDMLQSLRTHGIKAEQLSVDRPIDPYEILKNAIYEKRLICHEYPLLKQELERLELVNGEKVDHPNKGSKDVADAVCGVVYNITKTYSNKIITFSPDFVGKREFVSDGNS